ncbi:MAG: flippase, partial [Methanobacterium paludis]|nr:flippase [Methanobacterium paludis]
MDTARRIAKNTVLLLVSQLLVSILFFLSMLYTARYLGANGFGILSTALALTVILGLFSDLGLNTLTTREVARDKSLANKYIGNTLVMKLFLAFVTFGSIEVVANLFYSQDVLNVTYILALSVILDSFSSTFYSIFQAYEKMEYQSMGKVIGSFLLFVGVIISIYYGLSVVAFAYIYFVASSIILVYTFIVCVWKFLLPKIEIDLNFWRTTIFKALPLSLVLIFGVIYFRIDMVLLSILKGSSAVGIYSASYRLMDFLTFIPVVFTSSILPVLSRFYLSSENSLKVSYKLSFKYLFIIGLPIAVGITILANNIILLIYTAAFTESIISLQ